MMIRGGVGGQGVGGQGDGGQGVGGQGVGEWGVVGLGTEVGRALLSFFSLDTHVCLL